MALKGLAAIKAYNEEQQRKREAAAASKIPFMKLSDGEQAEIRFLQELDLDSEHYNPERGVAVAMIEHSNPDNWKVKAQCTMEEEDACVGCEQYRSSYGSADQKGKGWRPNQRLYINALLTRANEDPEVVVVNTGLSAKATLTNVLLDVAEEDGSITNRPFKIKRKGSGTDTTYTLRPLGIDNEVPDVELHDLEKVTRYVPYNEQAAFYGIVGVTESSSKNTIDDDWV